MASFVMVLAMLLALMPVGSVTAFTIIPLPYGEVEAVTTGGTVTRDDTTQTTTVSYDNVVLEWVPQDDSLGRPKDGAWIGIKITAPLGLLQNNGASFVSSGGTSYDFWENTDTEDGQGLHIWSFIDPQKLNEALEAGVSFKKSWTFNWNHSALEDQIVELVINPADVEIKKGEVSLYPVKGNVAAISGAGVADIEELGGTTAVSYNGEYSLTWSPADASLDRLQEGWWSGIQITAPDWLVSLEGATYQKMENSAWSSDQSFKASEGTERTMGMWVCLTKGMKEAGTPVVTKWRFDWDGDGIFEQLVTYTIDVAKVNLETISQDGFGFETPNPEDLWIGTNWDEDLGRGTYTNPARGHQGDVAVRYSILSGNAAINGEGVLIFDQPGQITVRAVVPENGPYQAAEAQYTINIYKKDGLAFTKSEDAIVYSEGATYPLPDLQEPGNATIHYALTEESKAIAELKDGVLTIKKAGTVTVKAAREENALYTAAEATFTLTVEKAEKGLTFSEGTTFVGVDDIQMPTPSEHQDGDTYTYRVISQKDANGDEATQIAEVDTSTGKITALAAGEVIIEVTRAANDYYSEAVGEYKLKIEYLPSDGLYTIDGEVNENDWYNVHPILSAAIGYEVQLEGDDLWNDSIVMTSEGGPVMLSFRIRRVEDGAMTAPIEFEYSCDTMAPTDLNVTMETPWTEQVLEAITFGFYQAKTKITISAKDAISGVASIEYWFEYENGEVSERTLMTNPNPGEEWETVVTVDGDFAGKVCFNATDVAGNKSGDGCSTNLVVDNTAPVVEIICDPAGTLVDDKYYVDATCGVTVRITETYFEQATIDISEGPVADLLNAVGEWTVNGNTYTKEISLEEDGEYLIDLKVTDLVDYECVASKTIVVDKTKPVIQVEAMPEPNSFMKEACVFKITVTEANLDRIVVDDKVVEWTQNGDTYTAELTFEEDGVHQLVINCTDWAGNQAEPYDSGVFVIDKTLPVCDVSYSVEATTAGEFTYYREAVTATIKITEANFDASLIKIDGEALDASSWTREEGTDTWTTTKTFDVDGTYALKIAGTDLAGNVMEDYADEHIVVDTVDPEVTVVFEGSEDAYFNEREMAEKGYVPVTITVVDGNFAVGSVEATGNLAGSKVYKITETGELEEITDLKAYLTTAENWTATGNQYVTKIAVTADGKYNLKITAADFAQRTAAGEKSFVIDTEGATSELSYSGARNTAEVDGIKFSYYNDGMTVSVKATDTISGVAKFAYRYVSADGGTILSGNVADIATEGNAYTASFTIPQGNYNGYVEVITTDYAGNETKLADTKNRIVVDTIAPAATVSFSEPASKENDISYYAAEITATIIITEANFYGTDVVVNVNKDGSTSRVTPSWSNASGDAYKATISLPAEGEYTISVEYADRSGNTMEDIVSGEMILDKTLPTIKVSGLKANSANKEQPFSFVITIEDEYLKENTIAPALTALLQGENGTYSVRSIATPSAKATAGGKQYVITVDDLADDAVYNLTCSAADKAGNVGKIIVLDDNREYDAVQFSINRKGSTFSVDENTAQLLNYYYVYEAEHDVVIFETNVDPIENYTLKLNGQELKEGTDFTTQQTTKSGEWSKRTYVINKALFAEEGQYTVTVESTDKAGSVAYSDVKGMSVSFIVDRTAPVLTVSGLTNGGRYQVEEQTVTVLPTDDGGRLYSFKAIVLDAEGNPLKDADGKDISLRIDLSGEALDEYLDANNGMITFTVPEGLENQVRLICNDSAHHVNGTTNETVEEYQVTVSQSFWIIFYANKGLFYGAIGGVGAAALLAILLIVLKKKKK